MTFLTIKVGELAFPGLEVKALLTRLGSFSLSFLPSTLSLSGALKPVAKARF